MILPNLTEFENKQINKQIDFYIHKCGLGGIRAFRLALMWFSLSKDLGSIASACNNVVDSFKKCANALQGQVRAIRSE